MRAIFVFFGGQRQWARLALALAQGAPVPLLDEPTTFLDPAHAISFWSSFASKPALVRGQVLGSGVSVFESGVSFMAVV